MKNFTERIWKIFFL